MNVKLLQVGLLAAVLMTGCNDAASDSGDSGGGGGDAQGGKGGGTAEQGQPSDATSAEECIFEGGGGSDLNYCDVFSAVLSSPVEADGLTATVTTNLGPVTDADGRATFTFISDPVERLTIEAPSAGPSLGGGEHFAPEWVEVELQRDGTVIGSARFDRLTYSCRAESPDDWCWEAAPVTLAITP